jgi:hypothetical protein
MDEHMKVQEELGSFKEVIVKEGGRVIQTKWVFVVKKEPSGKIKRFKALYVLLGFLQKYGVDYKEVFSPTIRGEQIQLMVSVGAKMKGMRLRKGIKVIVLSKGDMTSAYTTTPIPKGEEVMFELPQGYKPKMAAPKGYKVVGLSLKAQQGMK